MSNRTLQGDRNIYSCLFVMPCLLRLLYGTGIRIGEALALDNRDVDLEQRCLTLRATKNTKDRFVPFSGSLATVFEDYFLNRDALPGIGINDPEKHFSSHCQEFAVGASTFQNGFAGSW